MILTSGCFDGFHVGHLRYLQAAKALSPDRSLVVAVASDRYIETRKQRTPRWSQEDRLAVVLALGIVDRVVLHGIWGAANTIHDLRPFVFVKGKDWEDRLPDDVRAGCQLVGTRIAFVDSKVTRHTSDALSPVLT